MKKWRIKTKRDWVIAFVFAALLVYGVLGRVTWRLNRILMYWTDPRLSDLNQPSGYANVAFTGLIMGILAGIVLLAKNKTLKKALLAWGLSCAVFAASIGAYFFHCSLLVHVPMEETPRNIWVHREWEGEYRSVSIGYDPADESLTAFLALCTSLEELPKKEQAQARTLYEENRSENGKEETGIWISYPRKYLHSYSLLLYIDGGQIFARRDGGADLVFFADNGLEAAAEELLDAHQNEG